MKRFHILLIGLLIILFLIPGYLFAQNGKLRGRIVDGKTNQPISGVTVTIQGTGFSAVPDLGGNYSFINVPAGTYTVQITLVGYGGLSYTNVPVYSAQTTIQNFILAQSPAQVYTVTNTNNTGPGSLRQAITDADNHAGFDVIRFNIPGGGPYTIQPTETNYIPPINDLILIDGTTQFSVSGFPVIELNGINTPPGTGGLLITAGNSTIRGLIINEFPNRGIMIATNGGNVIEGNFIGLDRTGTSVSGNGWQGVYVSGTPNNTIGGTTGEKRNVISGNGTVGIGIIGAGATGNKVIGNFIGTDKTGKIAIGNADGVQITNAPNNEIGGITDSERNLISGNSGGGIVIDGTSGNGNKITGNRIGLKWAENTPLANGGGGIRIQGAPSNTIGGTAFFERNLISGNTGAGVEIRNNTASGNVILNNFIGTDSTAAYAVGNTGSGIFINNAPGNTIGSSLINERNIISGNNDCGVVVSGIDAQNNYIFGNYLGTNLDGSAAIGNNNAGIRLNSPNNVVGGASTADRNLISGNVLGVVIQGSDANDNRVLGNYIGTDVTGTSAIPNSNHGIFLGDGTNNTIGPNNLISGNTIFGVLLIDNAHGNRVVGNYIGTDVNGTASLPNSIGVHILRGQDNTIGGTATEDRNIISGNNTEGILIYGQPGILSSGNVIQGNFIGTDYTGTLPLGNSTNGIRFDQYSKNNTIGGITANERNIISGNGADGIEIGGVSVNENKVIGNYIGTDNTGSNPIGNAIGVHIWNASNNTIGGATENERNIISGNTTDGLRIFGESSTGNKVIGNYIGTDQAGSNKVGNGFFGIHIWNAQNNNIGGVYAAERNIISGNNEGGIKINGEGIYPPSAQNIIHGNYIGTNADGAAALGNTTEGILLGANSTNNLIGGTESGAGNIIAYNGGAGIGITTNNHSVEGNQIYGNGTDGIFITGAENTIGGETVAKRNFIFGNTNNGIAIFPSASNNIIQGNYLGTEISGNNDNTNAWDGIGIGGSNNSVLDNLISGYTHQGVLIMRWSVTDPIPEFNVVEGNRIGTNATGTVYVPNGQGVTINSAVNNTIRQNTIAGNEFHGILISDDISAVPTGNLINENSIFDNGNLGIDLGGDWQTSNDVGDGDTGPNNLQNFPELTSVEFGSGNVTITGSLNSTPSANFILQFFASKLADPGGYGEGQTYIGAQAVVTDGSGNVDFSMSFPIRNRDGQVITATATDENNNTSEFSKIVGGAKTQEIITTDFPLTFVINETGDPAITDGSDIDAIVQAFNHWDNISTSEATFTNGGTTTQQYAGNDGVNLITFSDDQFELPPGVLAVAAKTIEIGENEQTARIIDADIVFNPRWSRANNPNYYFGTDTDAGYFDIESIATHEIGHLLGLLHSGVVSSTMFFYLQPGTGSRSLETDDIAWVSYRYPNIDYSSNFGEISGAIKDGYNPGSPVAGALVYAINETSGDSVHAFSDEIGSYVVPGLINGSYKIAIEPLDGDVDGYPLTPANISPYIFAITTITDFPNEFYNDPDEFIEDASLFTQVTATAGSNTTDKNLVTNKDIIPPEIVSVSPNGDALDVTVFTPITVKFSEPINRDTWNESNFSLSTGGSSVPGQFDILRDTIAVFYPGHPLEYEATYLISISGVEDKKNNPLTDPWNSSFTTEARDFVAPTITQIIPADDAIDVFITTNITVQFSEAIDPNSLTDQTFTLNVAGQNVSGAISQSTDLKTAFFTPQFSLAEATSYTITLTDAIQDLAGNQLQETEMVDFTTVAQAEPVVVAIGPENGKTDVSVTTPILVDFSEPMDVTSFDYTTTFILNSGAGPVVGDFDASLRQGSRVIFSPLTNLQFNTTYTLTITGVRDISQPSQTMTSTAASSFTTAAAVVEPRIDYIVPNSTSVGMEIVISGEGFSPFQGENIVQINGIDAAVTPDNLFSLNAIVPQQLPSGAAKVQVIVNNVPSNEFDFYIVAPIDDPLNQVIAEVDADTETHDGDITPDGAYAYITNAGADNVSVIDIVNAVNVGNPIAVGDVPLKIAINPQGTFAYITNFGSHTVSVIDIKPNSISYNQVVATIAVGINPIGIAVTPDGKWVYVANFTSQNLSVIDVDENSGAYNYVVANVDTDTENRDIEIGPDGSTAYVTGSLGLLIIDINPQSTDYNHVVAEVDTDSETRDVEITPDGAYAVVTTVGGNILIIDIYPQSDAFGEVVAEVDSDTESHDLDILPDGLWVFVTDYDANTVSVYEFLYTFGASPMAVGSSLDNSPISTSVTLRLIDTIPVGDNPEGIIIDSKGERLVVANSGSDNVSIINISVENDAIQQCIEDIDVLLADPNTPDKAKKPLEKAKSYLQEALDKLAAGKIESAFTKIKKAVQQLEKAEKKGAETTVIIDTLVKVCRSMAEDAIHDAIKVNGDAKKIEKAEKELEKGDNKYDKGKPAKAIEHYKNAWKHAQKAMKKNGEDDDDDDDDDLDKKQKNNQESIGQGLPEEFSLSQSYPNPANPNTTIQYAIPKNAEEAVWVEIKIYNILGQVITTLVQEVKFAGRYSVTWDGTTTNKLKVPSGIYIYKIQAGNYSEVRKMILMQ